MDIFEEIARVKRDGGRAVLATIVEGDRGSPGKVGFRMLVHSDGHTSGTIGGGLLEVKVREEALRCMSEKKTRLVEFTLDEQSAEGIDMQCGGKVKVFLEMVESSPRLYVFGGGHIAVPLVQFAKLLEYAIIVVDDREEFANEQRFPLAERTESGDYAKLMESFEFRNNDCVVIITHGHLCDELVLKGCLSKSTLPGYIGMIGSRDKVTATFSNLREQGVSDDLLVKVHAPIGLDIGAKTPAEIALSIMAEIVAERYGKTVKKKSSP